MKWVQMKKDDQYLFDYTSTLIRLIKTELEDIGGTNESSSNSDHGLPGVTPQSHNWFLDNKWWFIGGGIAVVTSFAIFQLM